MWEARENLRGDSMNGEGRGDRIRSNTSLA